MRMIDLLRHTSGLTYGFQTRTPVDAVYRKRGIAHLPVLTLPEMIDALGDVPLEFSPGEAWNYSVSTDVLGYIVEKVSGVPLATFFRERIFAPLGMNDTGFQVAPENADRLTACYQFDKGGMALQDDPADSPFLKPVHFVSGGGGLVASASDYLKFCRMLLGGGAVDGVRLLSPKTVAFMTSNHLPGGGTLAGLSRSMFSESAYEGVGFGLGFAVTVDPVRTLLPGTVGDFYWGGMASTYFWIDPREDLIVIFMTQLLPSTSYAIRRELRGLVYAAVTESFV
jgi:CubicO group peptidase (beta-lactamase class C family)